MNSYVQGDEDPILQPDRAHERFEWLDTPPAWFQFDLRSVAAWAYGYAAPDLIGLPTERQRANEYIVSDLAIEFSVFISTCFQHFFYFFSLVYQSTLKTILDSSGAVNHLNIDLKVLFLIIHKHVIDWGFLF